MEYSLRREPWWNAVKRARSKRARAASQDAAVVTLRLPAFRFLHFFVARVERSETRERRWSQTFVPGFRCAQSRLRNDETGVSEDRKLGPTPDFLKAEPGSSCRSSESRAARDAPPHVIFTTAIFTTMSGD